MIKITEVNRSPSGEITSVRTEVDGKDFRFVSQNGKIVQVSSSPIYRETWEKMFKRVVAVFHSSDREKDQLSLNI